MITQEAAARQSVTLFPLMQTPAFASAGEITLANDSGQDTYARLTPEGGWPRQAWVPAGSRTSQVVDRGTRLTIQNEGPGMLLVTF
jgi:hypothetical protein